MNAKTESQLNKRIEKLEEELGDAETRAQEAEEKLENLQEQLEDGRATWAQPRKWEDKALPVPRLEMHWSRLDSGDGYNTQCLYALVYRHLLDSPENPEIIAKPMGLTRSGGGAEYRFRHSITDAIDTPFRDGAHAMSDALQLNLPLFVTTEDGDVDEIVFAQALRWQDGTQVIRKRASR